MSLGKRLKKLREINNKQQKEVAIELNIPKATLSSYENDLRLPSLQNLIMLADYYHTTVDYLLCRDTQNDGAKTIADLEQVKNFITTIQNNIKK